MDLTSAKIDDVATFELRHPVTDEVLMTDDGEPMTITVYGRDSEHYRGILHQRANRELSNQRRKRTAQEQEKWAIELLAACTKSWHIQLEGKKPRCTPEAAEKLYREMPWVREQVDAFIHDRANFLKSSSGTSKRSPSNNSD